MVNTEQVWSRALCRRCYASLILGEVRTWDIGTYDPLDDVEDMNTAIDKGKLSFRLHGKKLKGEFYMIRSRFGSNQRGNQWLLMKKRDEFADEHFVLECILDYGSRRERSASPSRPAKKRE